MRRYWLSCVCLLLALQPPLQAAVARAATALPVLTPGVVEQDYSQQISLAVSGAAPFTYLLGGDDKPGGLLLDPQSGILHGSPTAAALGTHRLKVIVTDYNGKQTSKDFLLRVTQAAAPAAATPASVSTSKAPPAIHQAALSSKVAPIAATTPAPPASLPAAPPAPVPATLPSPPPSPAPATPDYAPTIASATGGSKSLAITAPDKFPPGTKTATYAVYHVNPGKPCAVDASKQINTAAATSIDAKEGTATSLTLLEALQPNSQNCGAVTYTDDAGNKKTSLSNVVTVTSLDANWGLVRAYFVGGILISNDSSSFSSAHQFYALNLDKTWKLPGCYLRVADGSDRFTCVGRGAVSSVDLAGSTVTLQGAALLEGATITVTKGTEIKNATFTVTAKETITINGDSFVLQPGETFTVTDGTVTGGDITDGRLGANAVIAINSGEMTTWMAQPKPAGLWSRFSRVLDTPGVSTYFETRLTAIPVVSNSTNTNAADTTPSTASFLTSQQTANVGVGVYLPFLLSRWNFNNTPNALFIAPFGKVGFNTLTGATSQTVVLPSAAGTGTQSFEQIYNHYDYGFRIGHMGLTTARNVAPETYSYLDIGLGRYSNLEDLICHRADQGGKAMTGDGCSVYGSQYTVDSRKRLYRVDIEGLLKIPDTIFYVGLNANIGQKQVMAQKLDPAFTAPDDLRFLFGTRFDIAQLFARLGVKTQ